MVTATETRGEGELEMRRRNCGPLASLWSWAAHEKTYLAQDLIVPSPGVPADDPFLLFGPVEGDYGLERN